MEIEVKITKFEQWETFVTDINPVVNDSDYIEVITAPNRLHYEYNGCKCCITSKGSKEDMIAKMKNNVIFDNWFEENWNKTFTSYDLPVPKVYDHEEDVFYNIDSIDDFVNNCKNDDCYEDYKNLLMEIAKKEIKVTVKTVNGGLDKNV